MEAKKGTLTINGKPIGLSSFPKGFELATSCDAAELLSKVTHEWSMEYGVWAPPSEWGPLVFDAVLRRRWWQWIIPIQRRVILEGHVRLDEDGEALYFDGLVMRIQHKMGF